MCEEIEKNTVNHKTDLSAATLHQVLFDFKSSDRFYFVGNISEEMTWYGNNKSMADSFCDKEKEMSELANFKSDLDVQNFLFFYKSSKTY